MRKTVGAVLVAVAILSGVRAEGPGDYLKDGKLTERIEVRQLQGGFAGFTGTYTTVEPDGSWASGPVGPGEKLGAPKAKGKLSAEQMTTLAKHLARYDLAGLTSYGGPMVNPRVVKIGFGNKVAALQPNPGKGATPEEDKAVRARYTGIVKAIEAVARE